MTTTEYQYWPKDKPIPDGWKKTGRMHESHHGVYSIIIKRHGIKTLGQAAQNVIEGLKK